MPSFGIHLERNIEMSFSRNLLFCVIYNSKPTLQDMFEVPDTLKLKNLLFYHTCIELIRVINNFKK